MSTHLPFHSDDHDLLFTDIWSISSPVVAEHPYFRHINGVCKKVTLTVHYNVAFVFLKNYNRGKNLPENEF